MSPISGRQVGSDAAAPVLVVMGVSGSGKSTFGAALASALRLNFVDGDDLQPAANLDKMRCGHALDNHDREPWLAAITAVIAAEASHPAAL